MNLFIIYLFVYLYLSTVGPVLTLEDVSKDATNSTSWVEFEEGSDFTLSCFVNSSFPAVRKLVIQPSCHQSDCNEIVRTDNSTFINITVTGASSKKNSKNYTCTGRTGHTTGFVIFQTFVGGLNYFFSRCFLIYLLCLGPPDKTKVTIKADRNSSNVKFTMTVTDSSNAPPRTIIYTDPSVKIESCNFNVIVYVILIDWKECIFTY